MKHSVIRSEVTETLKLIALLLHNLSIKQADGAMGYLGIMLIMRYHDDGGALVVQLGSRCITSAPFLESRLPVGSSARMSFGPKTTARAMATRCC